MRRRTAIILSALACLAAGMLAALGITLLLGAILRRLLPLLLGVFYLLAA